MTRDDEIDDAERRREHTEQLRTEWEAEGPALKADMAARAEKLKSDELMEWCRQRAEVREAHVARRDNGPCDGAGRPLNDPRYKLDPVVTKSYAAQTQVALTPQADADHWDKWRKFILSVVGKKFIDDEMLGKVIKHLGEQITDWDLEVCKATKEAREKALEPLRVEIAQLRVEVAELRGATSQRSSPTSVAEERRRAGQLTRAKQEIERLRAQMNCDGTARDLDLGRVRGAFDEWRH